MSNVYILEARRVEIHAASIRRKLASLRRVKAIKGTLMTSLERNPALDEVLTGMLETHRELEKATARFRACPGSLNGENAILKTAKAVLMDAAEIVELLLWLGARPPGGSSGQVTDRLEHPS